MTDEKPVDPRLFLASDRSVPSAINMNYPDAHFVARVG